jgi:hypothetical protein
MNSCQADSFVRNLLGLVLIYGPQAKAININEPARIRVQVKNSEGKPIQGGVVTLEDRHKLPSYQESSLTHRVNAVNALEKAIKVI